MQGLRGPGRAGLQGALASPGAAWRLAPWAGGIAVFAAGFASRWAAEVVLPPGFPSAAAFPVMATGVFAFACATAAWLGDRLARERRAHAVREAQMRAMLDTSPVGIVLVELPSGRVLESGSQLERLLKRPTARSANFRWQDEWVSYHADGSLVAAHEYPMARMILENAEAPELEVHHQRGDGVRTWTRIMGRAIRNPRGELIGGVLAFVDIDAERRAQQDAQRLADEFRALADNIPILCWMAGADGHFYWFNRRWYDYIGASPKIGADWGQDGLHDPEVLPRLRERWRESLETGAPFEMTFPMKGADGVSRPFLSRAVPIRDGAGQITRWFGVNIEVSEQQRYEQQQRLLINELNHRVKNTLATIQSIGAQTLRSGKEPGEIFENFEARLISLSEAHNLLTQQSWEGADVGDIVKRAALPFERDDRTAIEASGPPVWLRSESALGLAMTLHELATNAVKYGALSTTDGHVSVLWCHDPATGDFQLDWTESGGPAVEPPTRRGFGLRLVARALAGETHSSTEVSFRPEGLCCRITAKLPPAPQSDAG